MNTLTRYEIVFAEPGEDPRFAKVKSIVLSQRIRDDVVSIWPTGGNLYRDQVVLVSKDGHHTTILRGNCLDQLKKLLKDGYIVVNGVYPRGVHNR